jgi:hypothetical protein
MTMAYSLPRLVLAGGFALAIAATPVVAAVATTAGPAPTVAACANGESEDTFTTACTPDLVPNSPLPSVDGIPCTGANSGQCIGLSESQNSAPIVTPHSEVSSSP